MIIYLRNELQKIEAMIKELGIKRKCILDYLHNLEIKEGLDFFLSFYFLISLFIFGSEILIQNNQDIQLTKFPDSPFQDRLHNDCDSQGFLNNSVVDLARNIFENVDLDIFHICEFPENEKKDSSPLENHFFFNEIVERGNKPKKANSEIISFNKKLLKVVFFNILFGNKNKKGTGKF